MTRNPKNSLRSIIYLAIAFIVGLLLFWFLSTPLNRSGNPDSDIFSSPSSSPVLSIDARISLGEKILLSKQGIADLIKKEGIAKPFLSKKQSGVVAFANGDFEQASQELESAIDIFKNDPETLIYLNNARIGGQEAYTLAVSAPLGSQDESKYRANSLAILRGVAQAQKELNENQRIDGVPLQVMLVDDDNDGNTAKRLAEVLAKEEKVLGVIGHFSSGTTKAAKQVYDSRQLPVISATSTSVDPELTKSDYLFRTVPNDAFTGSALADYMLKDLDLQDAFVFYGEESNYSKSLKDKFIAVLVQGGGRMIGQSEFDLSKYEVTPEVNSNAAQDKQKIASYVEQVVRSGAQAFMLAGYGGDGREGILDEIYEVIRAADGSVGLLGGDELYDRVVLEKVGAEALGMVVAAAWNINIAPNSKFNREAFETWGAPVNWFTAMTYDASQAFIEAIRRSPKPPIRSTIQQALSSDDFTAPGALEEVRFNSVGDRNGKVYLVEIKRSDPEARFPSGTGFDFIPIKQ